MAFYLFGALQSAGVHGGGETMQAKGLSHLAARRSLTL
jgi:hypothetical protein